MTSDTAGQAQMPCILSGARPRVLAEPGASLSSMPAPRSHPQAQEPGLSLPQVCGRLGAGLPQLLPPVHSVYLAGWFPPHPAEVTEASELPRCRIAASQAEERQRPGAAAGPRCLHGGPEWECSLVGAGGTQRGLPWWAVAWSPPGKGHLQRTEFPKTKREA